MSQKSFTVRTKDRNHSIVLLASSAEEAIKLAKEYFPKIKNMSKIHANVKIEPSVEDLEVVS